MPDNTLCISFCDIVHPGESADNLERRLALACREAGFPGCERIYAGSYFCENYFLHLDDGFHTSVGKLRERHELGATLVIPIFGQAFINQAGRRIAELLERFDGVYDEIVVNDVACFSDLAARTDKRIGIGRLFSKELRDPRYPGVFEEVGHPQLSPEAISCLQKRMSYKPLIDLDPTHAILDASSLRQAASEAGIANPSHERTSKDAPFAGDLELAVHLPYCYATTGRNCSSASIDVPDSEKFRFGGTCALECLRMKQGSRIEPYELSEQNQVHPNAVAQQDIRYVKHGRTYFFPNPCCAIAGVEQWRIIYSAPFSTRSE